MRLLSWSIYISSYLLTVILGICASPSKIGFRFLKKTNLELQSLYFYCKGVNMLMKFYLFLKNSSLKKCIIKNISVLIAYYFMIYPFFVYYNLSTYLKLYSQLLKSSKNV
jgi:hypothetical protein